MLMYETNSDLEGRLNNAAQTGYRSIGERKIANFLADNQIDYQYESGVLVKTTGNRSRIWYPDFYLPESKSYIEYFGVQNDPAYMKGIKFKKDVYLSMGIDVIAIYPWMFRENWQGYVMRELKRNTRHRYRQIMAKPYWSEKRRLVQRYPEGGGYRRLRYGRY